MTEARTLEDLLERPTCYQCGERQLPAEADRHIVPIDCQVCPRCKMMPACYTCRNMYCSCEVHQH